MDVGIVPGPILGWYGLPSRDGSSDQVLDLADVLGRALMSACFGLVGLLSGEHSTGLFSWLLFSLSRAVRLRLAP